MAQGGWNKGIKNSTGIHKGTKHRADSLSTVVGRKRSVSTVEKLKNRPKECYKKPKAEHIKTDALCDYGCGLDAAYQFSNGKVCCQQSHNSCPAKRKQFSDRTDHKENAAKSLATRTRLGITKTSQLKGGATRRAAGHYQILAEKMKSHWESHAWDNNNQCPLLPYKTTTLNYQGSYEYAFLEKLEHERGIKWVAENVSRGPSIWYNDPGDNTKRLYISDFIVYNTIYEIKSQWTWNRHGADIMLENKNREKLNECIRQGYEVILVLDKQEQEWK